MVCVNPDGCSAPAAPSDVGNPYYVYDGATPTGTILAKTLTVGNEYTFQDAAKVTGYRVYTVTGNDYSVYLIGPTGAVTELINFEAGATGWASFITANQTIYPGGTTFTLGVNVTEPDPTPTIYTLSYNYITPNIPGVPASGTISHANQLTASFRVHKTGQTGDNSADLANMEVGDVIDGAALRWSISGIADMGTWIDFTVAPTSQGFPDGIQDFQFETVTATPITTVIDVDYYLGNPAVQPFYIVDGGAPVYTDTGYGVDVEVQPVSFNEDWEFFGQL
jgi:hypothetical protein